MNLLVIEDDPDVALSLVDGLRDAGHAVDHASNGAVALALGRSKHFDVIILDRMLPHGEDGLQILATLRQEGVAARALVLSGLGLLTDWMQGLEAGGDDYLVKPASLAEICRRVALLQNKITS